MSCGCAGGGGRYGITVYVATSGIWTGGNDVVFVFEVFGRVKVALMGFEVDGDLKFG